MVVLELLLGGEIAHAGAERAAIGGAEDVQQAARLDGDHAVAVMVADAILEEGPA